MIGVTVHRTPFAVLLIVAACLPVAGCSITRKSASIDSISRTPFFGLELAPKRHAPAPETQRIRQETSSPAEVRPAKLIANGVSRDSTWWERLTGTEKRTPIPLPRTDVADSSVVVPPPARLSSEETPLEFW